MALMPTERMGPPPGASPRVKPVGLKAHADAHDWIMVRIKRPYRIQVCGTKMRPNGELPLGSSTDRQAPSDAEAMQKALSQFIIAPPT